MRKLFARLVDIEHEDDGSDEKERLAGCPYDDCGLLGINAADTFSAQSLALATPLLETRRLWSMISYKRCVNSVPRIQRDAGRGLGAWSAS